MKKIGIKVLYAIIALVVVVSLEVLSNENRLNKVKSMIGISSEQS